MEEITRFVMLAQSDRFTVTELCEQFGISRKTGHKHLERYATGGLKGLQRSAEGRSAEGVRPLIVNYCWIKAHPAYPHLTTSGLTRMALS